MRYNYDMSAAHGKCLYKEPYARPWYERWFPLPESISPRGAGVDISDSSIKWLELAPAAHGHKVKAFAQASLEGGVVVEGVVHDPQKLGDAIGKLRAEARGGYYVHAALPEETAFVFTMNVVNVHDRIQVLRTIEFELEDHVPLKFEDVSYDYDVVKMHGDDTGAEISVSVFPKSVVEGYVSAFKYAGVRLLSLELEASSVARSIMSSSSREVALAVDFGRARSGIVIFNCGVPIFTSTVAVGGDAMTKVIMDTLKVDERKAENIKNEEGIRRDGDKKVTEAVLGTASSLADEIVRHYQYWDSRRDEHGNRVTPVSRVLLTGGSSNLKGLDEYIAGRVKAPTIHADVWRNVCSYDVYIPPIDVFYSLGLSTAIGLALRGT